jgi:micrococcal nuclease
VAAVLGAARPSAQVTKQTASPQNLRLHAQWVELERVVDGDTLHVRRAGKLEKLRLLSVDTEERLGPGHASTPSKPQTVYGEECAIWAEKLFASLAKDGEKPRVGLIFPGLQEKRDVYGRLLCHVLLPDGTNFNLMLVQVGRSPYFNKYGTDLIDPEGFAAAQIAARRAQLGIWNPATNVAQTPGAPSAKRPYAELLAWWNARAIAIDGYRKRAAADPARVADAEDPESLTHAVASGAEIDVFGEVDRLFDEKDGSRTVLFSTGVRDQALRVRIPAATHDAHDVLRLRDATREYRQNFFWVRGRVETGARGFEMRSKGPDQWRRAGPEPGLPAPPRAK